MNDTLWLQPAACPLLKPAVASVDPAALRLVQRLLELSLPRQSGHDLAMNLLEEITGVLRADQAAVFEPEPDWHPRWQHIRRGAWPPGECRPRALLAEILGRQAGASQAPADGTPAFLGTCLGSLDRPNGVLLVARPREAFQPAELEYAVAAGHYLGVGLARACSWDEYRQTLERLEGLVAVGRHLLQERGSGPLLDYLADQAARLLDCERTDILLWDPRRGELVGRPAPGTLACGLRIPDDQGVAGRVVQTGQAVQIQDVREEPNWRLEGDGVAGSPIRNLLAVPLVGTSGQRLGVFQACNKTPGPFTPQDMDTLQALAAHTAAGLAGVREHEALRRCHAQLETPVRQGSRLIGESTAIQALRATLERVARTDLPVLILGEPGTGKELVAHCLHYGSPRQHHPFVLVNCAGWNPDPLEDELFGPEQGAMDGAVSTRARKCEAAQGGTLFLDEVGDLSAGGQAQLLRILEERPASRVGGSQALAVDPRVVAASRRNLDEAVRAGKFREDLYYRLAVVTLELPPLSDRREDILVLAEHFLHQFCHDAGRRPLKLSGEARRRLEQYSWPGNVRELRNLLERVAFLSATDRVEAGDLAGLVAPAATEANRFADLTLAAATEAFQREHIGRAIERARHNMSDAAKLLGLHRPNLYRKMKMLGMDIS
jgi:Nif-specific regulatory protein